MKISYSQSSLFQKCPKHWSLQYQHKLDSEVQAASLFFGSAIDSSVMALLEGKQDYLENFYNLWSKAWSFGKSTQIFDSEFVVYSGSDFDEFVFKQKDKDKLLLWASELGLGDSSDVIDLYKQIAKRKKNPYKKISNKELKFYNRVNWLSMLLKGEILIECFKTDFLPRVKKVVATQKQASIKSESTGHSISGYIDMVLEIEGYDKPIIFDLKTAAQPYTQDQIDLSEQLTLYSAMKSQEYNTDLVGYVVLCKNIPKDTDYYCEKCGNKKKGKFRNCNAKNTEDKRCEGEWTGTKTLKPSVQVLIEKKTEEQVNDLLGDYVNIIGAIESGFIFKNNSACNSWFGSRCKFYNFCHNNGDMKGLIKK